MHFPHEPRMRQVHDMSRCACAAICISRRPCDVYMPEWRPRVRRYALPVWAAHATYAYPECAQVELLHPVFFGACRIVERDAAARACELEWAAAAAEAAACGEPCVRAYAHGFPVCPPPPHSTCAHRNESRDQGGACA